MSKLPPTGVIHEKFVFPITTNRYNPPQNKNTPIIKLTMADLIQKFILLRLLKPNTNIACNSWYVTALLNNK